MSDPAAEQTTAPPAPAGLETNEGGLVALALDRVQIDAAEVDFVTPPPATAEKIADNRDSSYEPAQLSNDAAGDAVSNLSAKSLSKMDAPSPEGIIVAEKEDGAAGAVVEVTAAAALSESTATEGKSERRSRDEITSSASEQEMRTKLKAVFDACDKDGSGSVSADEMLQVCSSLQLGITNEELREMIKAADADSSGEIEFDEFMVVFRNHTAEQAGGLGGIFASKAGSLFEGFADWWSGISSPFKPVAVQAAAPAAAPSEAEAIQPPDAAAIPPSVAERSVAPSGETGAGAQGTEESASSSSLNAAAPSIVGELHSSSPCASTPPISVALSPAPEARAGSLTGAEGTGQSINVPYPPQDNSAPSSVAAAPAPSVCTSPPSVPSPLSPLPAPTSNYSATPTRSASEAIITLKRPAPPEALGLRFYDEFDGFFNPRVWSKTAVRLGETEGILLRTAVRPVIRSVADDGHAAAAGLRRHDMVMGINGQTDISLAAVGTILRGIGVGDDIVLVVRTWPRRRSPSPHAKFRSLSSPAHGSIDSNNAGPSGVLTSPPCSPPSQTSQLSCYPPPPPLVEEPNGCPLTPRAVKTSIIFDKELHDVAGSVKGMIARLEQVLAVVRGQSSELCETAKSMQTLLRDNRTLTQDPNGKEATAAARAAVNELEMETGIRKRFEREPTAEMMNAEMTLECMRQRRRREELNQPIVHAIVELEEIASLGIASLSGHAERLQSQLEGLSEVSECLSCHHAAHHGVVQASDRARTHRPLDQPTHVALSLATTRKDSARNIANNAVRDATRERSRLEACKADVQRAVQARRQMELAFRRMDRAGTTFHAWTREELGVNTAPADTVGS